MCAVGRHQSACRAHWECRAGNRLEDRSKGGNRRARQEAPAATWSGTRQPTRELAGTVPGDASKAELPRHLDEPGGAVGERAAAVILVAPGLGAGKDGTVINRDGEGVEGVGWNLLTRSSQFDIQGTSCCSELRVFN